jgi:hypothetical protein
MRTARTLLLKAAPLVLVFASYTAVVAHAQKDPPGTGCINVTGRVTFSSHFNTNPTSCKNGVVGTLTNNTSETANCRWAFHKNGTWGDYGAGNIAAGKTQTGDDGIWTCGADARDTRYVCFAGADAVDTNGHQCIFGVKF